MAQDLSASLATKFQAILDEVYKASSLTARMDSISKPVDFAGASTVKVLATSMVGLADYVRETGYIAGDVTLTWQSLALAISRGREFSIDRMDNEETLGMAFGTLAGEFIRTQVVPEIDAYRFGKYASAGTGNEIAATTYTSSTILAGLDEAKADLNADSVPEEGRLLYISDSCKGFLEQAVTRMLGNENSVDRRVGTFDGMPVIMVPQSRFYLTVALTAGSATTGGFAGTYPLNFMIIHPSAVVQVAKFADLKVFSPDMNQSKDAWKIQYRLYHDAFVLTNKLNGISYCHKVAA
jgi:hypothetical protein